MTAISARQRHLEAATDHEAMTTAFSWLQAELVQNRGWQHSADPIGNIYEIKKNAIRRQVANAIVEAIHDLGDGSDR